MCHLVVECWITFLLVVFQHVTVINSEHCLKAEIKGSPRILDSRTLFKSWNLRLSTDPKNRKRRPQRTIFDFSPTANFGCILLINSLPECISLPQGDKSCATQARRKFLSCRPSTRMRPRQLNATTTSSLETVHKKNNAAWNLEEIKKSRAFLLASRYVRYNQKSGYSYCLNTLQLLWQFKTGKLVIIIHESTWYDVMKRKHTIIACRSRSECGTDLGSKMINPAIFRPSSCNSHALVFLASLYGLQVKDWLFVV